MDKVYHGRGTQDAWFDGRDWARIVLFWGRLVKLGDAPEWVVGGDDGRVLDLERVNSAGENSGEFASCDPKYIRRRTFALHVGYLGTEYNGYQKQGKGGGSGDTRTVEDDLDSTLSSVLHGRSTNASGRTDKGVSALSQCVSFTSFDGALTAEHIMSLINTSEPAIDGRLRCFDCRRVPRKFHSVYGCEWRRYIYLLPLRHEAEVDVSFINESLLLLQGQPLHYYGFTYGDVPVLETGGLDDECILFHSRARLVDLGDADGDAAAPAVCIELVGNRFLRRMCRSLVATVLREESRNERDVTVLHKISEIGDRRLAAFPAPAIGLCLAGVGYSLDLLDWKSTMRPVPPPKKVRSTREGRRGRKEKEPLDVGKK